MEWGEEEGACKEYVEGFLGEEGRRGWMEWGGEEGASIEVFLEVRVWEA
jgi:hypothetical protein